MIPTACIGPFKTISMMELANSSGVCFISCFNQYCNVAINVELTNKAIKSIELGLVSEDTGEMGTNLLAMLKQQMEQSGAKTFEWIEYDSVKDMEEAMGDKELYGALVVPADFTGKFASLQSPSTTSPTLQIYINEGMNSNVASIVSSALTNITTQMNHAMSSQILEGLSQANTMLQPSQVTLLAAPIQTETIKLHEVGSLGMAPAAFFQPIWIASLLGAVLFYLAGRNREVTSKGQKLGFHALQSALILVYGLFTGYLVTWATTWILDFSFDSFHTIALFSSLAVIAFTLLIFATVSWLKLPSLAFYALLMFFGLPLLQLAPEMVPDFYQNYVSPWLPMGFLFNGLKEILYFGSDLTNGNTMVLLWIAIISLIVCWIKFIVEKPIMKNIED